MRGLVRCINTLCKDHGHSFSYACSEGACPCHGCERFISVPLRVPQDARDQAMLLHGDTLTLLHKAILACIRIKMHPETPNKETIQAAADDHRLCAERDRILAGNDPNPEVIELAKRLTA